MKEKSTCIITSEWEYGAGKRGTSKGPQYVIDTLNETRAGWLTNTPIAQVPNGQHLPTESTSNTHIASDHPSLKSHLKNGTQLLDHQTLFANKVAHQLNSGYNCLLLTADHSNGIGGVSGLCQVYPAEEVGVIWIDAHYDLHSPYTTPSGNSHGMAVNALIDDNNTECQEQAITPDEALLWENIKSIKGMGNAVPSSNIAFIGVRDFEPAEAALVERLNICSIQPEQINQEGIESCIAHVLAQLAHCKYLYVSFDVDSMDPSISMATGTPVDGGLTVAQAKQLIQTFASNSKTQCIEITEFNPSLPQPKEMMAAIEEILSVSGLFE